MYSNRKEVFQNCMYSALEYTVLVSSLLFDYYFVFCTVLSNVIIQRKPTKCTFSKLIF
jgi:hypothetical protein